MGAKDPATVMVADVAAHDTLDAWQALVRLAVALVAGVDDGGLDDQRPLLVLQPFQTAHHQLTAAGLVREVHEGLQQLPVVQAARRPRPRPGAQAGSRAGPLPVHPSALVDELDEVSPPLDHLLQEDPLSRAGAPLVVREDLVEQRHFVHGSHLKLRHLHALATVLPMRQEPGQPIRRGLGFGQL